MAHARPHAPPIDRRSRRHCGDFRRGCAPISRLQSAEVINFNKGIG